jgi:hypothetical protein
VNERRTLNYRPSVWVDYFIKNPILPLTHEVHMNVHLCVNVLTWYVVVVLH